jgi:hypothetical protein
MKVSLCLLGLSILAFGATNTSAQVIRPCTNEVLTCRLDKNLLSGRKIFIVEKSETFSGFNSDEPSIQPDECKMDLWIEEGDYAFSVKLNDRDYMASIYTQNVNNLGRSLPGSVVFPLVKGRTFFYSYDKLVLSCSLL